MSQIIKAGGQDPRRLAGKKGPPRDTASDPSVVALTPGLTFPESTTFLNEAEKSLLKGALLAGWLPTCAHAWCKCPPQQRKELGLLHPHSSRTQMLLP